MSDDPEEFDENFDDDLDFEEFDVGPGPGGGSVKDNPLFKIGLVVAGIVVVIGILFAFGGNNEDDAISAVGTRSDLTDIPGSGEVSRDMKERIDEENQRRVEQAIETGESAMPIFAQGPDSGLALPSVEEAEEDPLERWRRIQEERRKQQIEFEPPPQFEGPDPKIAAVEALAEAMSEQMQGIVGTLQPASPNVIQITSPAFLDQIKSGDPSLTNSTLNNSQFSSSFGGQQTSSASMTPENEADIIDIIIPAGEIEYAQMITQANSDIPGPIIAQLVSGPLAGSRMIGAFESTDDYLILTFNTVIIDGISYSTSAVAINPKTANLGLATTVDKRYFRRIALPAAAVFIEGFAEAASESGSTTTTINAGAGAVEQTEEDLNTKEEVLSGVSEAASRVAAVLDEEADSLRPLVTVAAGTPMGLLFLEPVTDENQ